MLVFITGIGTLFVSFILSSNSPGKINRAYGYRTKKSMSNQTLWDFAQKYSAKIFSRIAIFNVILGLILMIFVTYSKEYYILFELGWVVLSILPVFFLTEVKLREMEKSL